GGYVKITGMSPAEELSDELRTRSYYAQPPWKRIIVIAAGPFMNIVIALVVLVIFFSAFGPVTSGNKVGDVQKGYPAYGVLQSGDRLVAGDGQSGAPGPLAGRDATHKRAEHAPGE